MSMNLTFDEEEDEGNPTTSSEKCQGLYILDTVKWLLSAKGTSLISFWVRSLFFGEPRKTLRDYIKRRTTKPWLACAESIWIVLDFTIRTSKISHSHGHVYFRLLLYHLSGYMLALIPTFRWLIDIGLILIFF